MTSAAICVENLSKRYQLGARESAHTTFREAATDFFAGPFRRLKSLSGHLEDEDAFWALKDVSFEVEPGEVVGIMGRNGAGKSTLLKILSQITEPTCGRIEINGRVASLLEVGTGFHQELSGRENIYLNGSILGMSRAEVRRKFDEIVAFSEIERFLDTPVKRYSSGMYVRLAFAVAAHLDPDVLVVDEVLAVGDFEFQKRCLGKMSTFSNSGRTILFVSHSVGAISRLCSRCIVMSAGSVTCDAPTPLAVSHYLAGYASSTGIIRWTDGIANSAESRFRFLQVRLLNDNRQPTATFESQGNLNVELTFRVIEPLRNCRVGFFVSTADGTCLFDCHDTDDFPEAHVRHAGVFTATCAVPLRQLLPGRYVISPNAGIPSVKNLAYVEGALSFDLHESCSQKPKMNVQRGGLMIPAAHWLRSPLP
jgi:lipopolysaccharide transport system ATP-binding protein